MPVTPRQFSSESLHSPKIQCSLTHRKQRRTFFKIAAYTQLHLSKPLPPPSPYLWQSPFHNRTDAGSRARVWRQGPVCAHQVTVWRRRGPQVLLGSQTAKAD